MFETIHRLARDLGWIYCIMIHWPRLSSANSLESQLELETERSILGGCPNHKSPSFLCASLGLGSNLDQT